ncbi:shTK domain protein [Oesophagostomum dentatum]|uniref:ShTK domain protein n=1 Tax=Oesophagostomum dentatum TaxID=61180 RepID=A0A0B1TBM2_OESDE|nr:shTK domain protein [Oesophagostomum dentatum]
MRIPKCPEWASEGECTSNAVWMMANCRRSCHSCQGGDKAWKLRTHIQANYHNTTDNVTKLVQVESVRINNVEIDEKKQNVKVFGRMVLSWNDTNIAWDKNQWGLSWLNFYWIQIWTPQIVQLNGASTSNPGQVTSKVLAANYTGQVYLWADFSFSTPFKFQYEDYPNDVQRVCFKFDDKRLLAVHFVVSDGVKNKEREATTDPFVSGWKIIDVDLITVSAKDSGCEDADPKCPEWASEGECTSNAVWMMANCRRSCHSCQGGDKAWKLRTHIQANYHNATDNVTKLVQVESVRINNVEIDEKKQNVKVFGRMVLSWNDTNIAWDKNQWGLSWLNFYWIQIWTPQIVQLNG